jgi:hypothetical protein
MIRFVSSSAAEPLSQALWSLSRPPAIRSADDTQYLFGWVNALNQTSWLMVDTEYEINVHLDAELGEITAILQPWIERQELPTETNTQLAALIESKRGQHLVVYDAFPQFFKDMSKTYEQMIAAGLLAEPDMP